MKMLKFLGTLVIAAAFGPGSTTVFAAEAYPSRPIKVIVPFSAGGQSDVVARLIAERVSAGLGQPMVIENVAGAGGMIAASTVARAAPDGYTLFLANASTLTIAPYLQKGGAAKLATFTPITTASQFPLVLVVNSSSPFKSLADVVAAAKANPGKLSFASPGYGTTPHLVGETLKQEAKLAITHVPYKGGGAGAQRLDQRADRPVLRSAGHTLAPHPGRQASSARCDQQSAVECHARCAHCCRAGHAQAES